MKLTLPVDDPFWEKHHPGDRWNCKCSLESTDEPVNHPDDLEETQPQRGLENNPGKDGHTFSDNHPYFPENCNSCPFNKGFKNKMLTFFYNEGKHCNSCRKIDTALRKTKSDYGITAELEKLHDLKGADFGKQLRIITRMKDFKAVKDTKNIFSAIGKDSPDYENLIKAAKKAASHGYTVYILPNPKGLRTADFIFVRKEKYKLFDLKTISGDSSVSNRLEESIGQTNRVLLNMATKYNPRRLAQDIKDYFNANPDAKEALIFKGKREITITRDLIDNHFVRYFIKVYGK